MAERKEIIQGLHDEITRLTSMLEKEEEQLSVSFISGVYDQLEEIKKRVFALESSMMESSAEQLRSQSAAIKEAFCRENLPEEVLQVVDVEQPEQKENLPPENDFLVLSEEKTVESVTIEEAEEREEEIVEEKKVAEPIVAPSQTILEFYQNQRVSSLNASFTMADYYRYLQNLFDNDRQKMGEALSALDSFTSSDEAMTYIEHEYSWDKSDPVTKDFLNLLKMFYS